ncbi:MAG TPA: immunoglobulin domain-containing protein, partial [Leadbetterella sp.]|nr:immunoglobulin domain-containing protein [Leadbetterella sp.]
MRKQLFEKSRFTLILLSVLFIFLLTESNIYGQCSAPPVYTSVGGNSAVLCEGGTMTPFTLNFTGATSFQWQRSPITGTPTYTNVPGQTTNTLSLSNVAKADEGLYRLVATNSCGSTNSNNTFQLQVRLKPFITTNPVASKSVCQGTTLSLSVGIGGNALSLTWFKDDVPISGQPTINLSVSNFQASNVGNYHAVVQPLSECAGFTATSSKSSVSLATNIAFDTQPPASQNICAGSNLVLAPTITGTATTYQWRKGGGNIAGQTNSTYSANNVNSLTAGNYSVVITGACNTLTSGNYTVNVTPSASISSNPTNVTKCVGENHTFNASAFNASRVEWLKEGSVITDGSNISGATTNNLTITNICSTCDVGSYAFRAYGNGACTTQSVTSNAATLSINEPINIISSTSSLAKCEGENVTLEVSATGAITGYQWKKAGTPITGQTSASLTLSNITTADAAEYSVDILGPCGNQTRSGIILTVSTTKAIITTNPVNAIKCVGESQTFTAAASNAGSYKWQKDGSDLTDGGNISGSSSSSLTISNLCATCDAGTYTVKAFGAGACASQSVTSSAATLTVNTPISITSVSTSQSKCEGENVTLEVVAAGTITSYQWKKAGNNITGQTNASLTLSNLTTADIAEYSVDIFGPCGTVSHSGINVAVALKPVFSLNPVNAIKCVGENQTFTAAASNAGSYKWQKDGSDLSDGGNISGSSTSSLTITNLCATCDAGTYTVKAFGTGACASQSVTSSSATLTVNTPISITSVSTSQSKCEGENVTLEVVAAGTITGYQWKKAGNNITGQTNASLTLTNLTTADIAEYSVDIFGPCGTVSHSGINVAVALKPVFSLNPVNAIKCVGESQTFTAAASNAGSYKWQKDGSDLSDGGNISGSSSSSLTIVNLCASCDAGTYTVKAFGTGACASQSVTSSSATLTVNTPISITSVSTSQSKCEGENVTLEVVAAGTITGYQWKKAGNNITGQTNASLTLTNLTTADISEYSVDIFGPCGTVSHSGINVAVALKPVFSLNPVNAIKCVDESQTFTASASNAGSYKWQKDGSDLSDGGNISGSSSSSLTITNLCATCDAGTYTVKAFGSGACASQSVTSSSATLTVNTPISITSVSTSQSKCEGENVTLEVVAAGTITGYQWKKAGNNITGQTNASLTLSNLTTADIAEYSVDIFGPCGTVSHSGINVAVALKPVFSLNPVNAIKCVGESQTFTAAASNAGSYKWQKDGSDLSDGGNISGSSSSSLTITNLCATCDAGTYTVKAFGTGTCASQSVTSSSATLTVNTPISITSVSTSQSKCEGENVTLEVVAAGTITGYQWKKAGNNITGQTNPSLTLSNLTTADIAEYSVDIFGPCGTVSHSGINVAVALKPVFSLNPVNAIKCVGESQTFTAAASNAGSYKWQKDGSDLSDGGNISGSSSSSLTIANLCAVCDAGTYTVKAFGTGSCASQSVTSSAATLTVNTPISITSVSTSQSKCEGENVTLEVVAAGTITGYQWKKAGNNITGQTNASLTLSNLTTADIAEYSVDIFGPCGTV